MIESYLSARGWSGRILAEITRGERFMPTSLTLEHYEMMHDTMPLMQAAVNEFIVDPKLVDAHLVGVANRLKEWANGELTKFRDITSKAKESAEEVLGQAMMTLNDAERHQFLLTNLLEGLKRGDSPADVVNRYNDIGLADIKIPAPPTAPPPLAAQPAIARPKPVSAIRKMMDGLASMCAPAINIALVAAKAISDRLKIKFKPITGTMAGLPSLHFLLEYSLEGEVKVSEGFKVLKSIFRRSSVGIG